MSLNAIFYNLTSENDYVFICVSIIYIYTHTHTRHLLYVKYDIL